MANAPQRVHGHVLKQGLQLHREALKVLPCEPSSKEWKDTLSALLKADVEKCSAFCVDYVTWIYSDINVQDRDGREPFKAYTAWWSVPFKDGGAPHLQRVTKERLNALHKGRAALVPDTFEDAVGYMDEAGNPIDIRWWIDRHKQKNKAPRASASEKKAAKAKAAASFEFEEYAEVQKKKEPAPEPVPAKSPYDTLCTMAKFVSSNDLGVDVDILLKKYLNMLGTVPLREDEEELEDAASEKEDVVMVDAPPPPPAKKRVEPKPIPPPVSVDDSKPAWLQLYDTYVESAKEAKVASAFKQIANSVATKEIGLVMFGAAKVPEVTDVMRYLRSLVQASSGLSAGKYVTTTRARGKDYRFIYDVRRVGGKTERFGLRDNKLCSFLMNGVHSTTEVSADAVAYVNGLPPYSRCLTLGLVALLFEKDPVDREVTAEDVAKKLAEEVDDMDFS
jgi:hypothetical protein